MSETASSPKRRRVAAIDWMRGLVMILMVVDHASMAFNADHIVVRKNLAQDRHSFRIDT